MTHSPVGSRPILNPRESIPRRIWVSDSAGDARLFSRNAFQSVVCCSICEISYADAVGQSLGKLDARILPGYSRMEPQVANV